MIRSKNNKNGFTLIEVLFALAILGSALTPLILNQSRFLSRIVFESESLDRTFVATHFMIESYVNFEQNNDQRTSAKSIDALRATLNFRISVPDERIKKRFKSLYKREVAVVWGEGKSKSQDSLVTFIFLPDLEEK